MRAQHRLRQQNAHNPASPSAPPDAALSTCESIGVASLLEGVLPAWSTGGGMEDLRMRWRVAPLCFACIPLVFGFYSRDTLLRAYLCFGTRAWLVEHPYVDGFGRFGLLPRSSARRNQIEWAGHSHRLP